MSLTRFTSIILLTMILYSCKKESFITSSQARLGISVDTLAFDTVFATAGSVTKSFKIFNLNNQKLLLSKVKLMGGATSSFKVNVDGISTNEASDLVIEGNDSIYVFVQVNINPSGNPLPFIVRDSILINYNGANRYVQLQAYGQNAVYLKNKKIGGNVTWTNALPYVILDALIVDTTATLTLQPGVRVYSHANAPFLVDGSLKINGTKNSTVTFAGDRLDPDYKDLPASWPGIILRSASKDNSFKFAVIHNAYQALVVQGPSINSSPKLVLSQCIIDNAYDAGIMGINTSIQADNSLVSNCGSNIFLALGGNYNFTHCSVAAYSNFFISHNNPVLQVSNFASQGNQTIAADLGAVFRNCIFWGEGGTVVDEVVVLKQGSTIFNVLFDHCLYKAVHDPANVVLTSVIKNQNPLFDSINNSKQVYDFHFRTHPNSPAINAGVITAFPRDLDDKSRANTFPDLGCYEL